MQTYNAIFQLKNQPPVEYFINTLKSELAIDLPGYAVFKLVNPPPSDEGKGEEETKSLAMFREEFNLYNLPEVELYTQRKRMNEFIKIFFLNQADSSIDNNLNGWDKIDVIHDIKDLAWVINGSFQEVFLNPFFHINNMLSSYEVIDHINASPDDIETVSLLSSDFSHQINSFKELLSFTWLYDCDSIFSICWVELMIMADSGVIVKSCNRCSDYYVPHPPNALHCRKCRQQYSAQSLYRKRKKEKLHDLTPEQREEMLKKEREKRAKYMREYRKRKKSGSENDRPI